MHFRHLISSTYNEALFDGGLFIWRFAQNVTVSAVLDGGLLFQVIPRWYRTIILNRTANGKCPVRDFLDELPGKSVSTVNRPIASLIRATRVRISLMMV